VALLEGFVFCRDGHPQTLKFYKIAVNLDTVRCGP